MWMICCFVSQFLPLGKQLSAGVGANVGAIQTKEAANERYVHTHSLAHERYGHTHSLTSSFILYNSSL